MATPLVIGWQATVSGLVNFPQLNGATVRLLANNGDRWRVRLGDDTYNIRPANLTGVDPEPEARELLRDAGRPQTEAYVQWQIRRMAGQRGATNPEPATEQVARRPRKNNGAVVTGLTEKTPEVSDVARVFGAQETITPLKDSTW